jgi:hypothetical protein
MISKVFNFCEWGAGGDEGDEGDERAGGEELITNAHLP